MTTYGLLLAGAMALCGAAFLFATSRTMESADAVFCVGASMLLGLICARAVYCATEGVFYFSEAGDWRTIFRLSDGGLSLFGGVLGALISCRWLAGPRSRRGAQTALRTAGPVLLLLCAACRYIEVFALRLNFGDYMDAPSVWTVPGDLGPRLNTGLIESLLLFFALAVCLLPAFRDRRALTALLFLGLTETFSISLRADSYLMWGFVHAEQLYFYLLAAAAVILLFRRKGRTLWGVACAVLGGGAIVFLEFALDGRVLVPFDFLKASADLFWYALFLLVEAALAVAALRQGRESA
ncbi:MAG: prolipoprotein diacylglyceryl transferase [Clostridia bacterium]|nr:prolipoprotein diacylglyceryl transferase [Clostridia bacterium]